MPGRSMDMATEGSTAESREAEEIVIVRKFLVSRELVWTAWSGPERFQCWWGPKGFTTPSCRIDLRVGGSYLACMRSPEGKDYWSTGVYIKVNPQKEIAFTDSFSDEQGNVVPASRYGLEGDWPREMLVMASFEEEGIGTRMTLRHVGVPARFAKDCETGWGESFDKLEECLETWRNPG
jgi:uncharacterized protein YndB with AHSA1/START domain